MGRSQENKIFRFGDAHASMFILIFAVACSTETVWAKKTNQPIYEETFDLAGGGSNLTRATQEGQLFANPALLPFGFKFYRWIGLKTTLNASRESIEFVQKMQDSSSSESEQSDAEQAQQIIEDVGDTPIHFGLQTAFSVLTNNVGFTAFGRAEPDIRIRERLGQTGMPEVHSQAEGYGGGVLSYGARLTRWLGFGVTAKYLYVTEPDLLIDLGDQESIANLASSENTASYSSINTGLGYDVGTLLFLQGNYIDLRLAGKVDDVGGTPLDGDADPAEFKQTIHAGLALTFHNEVDALHLSADLRDITQEYEESLVKRLYLGSKIMFRTYVGLAAGLYQGYPSYGAVLDLITFRVAGTVYSREYGAHQSVGVEPRNLYVFSFAIGY